MVDSWVWISIGVVIGIALGLPLSFMLWNRKLRKIKQKLLGGDFENANERREQKKSKRKNVENEAREDEEPKTREPTIASGINEAEIRNIFSKLIGESNAGGNTNISRTTDVETTRDSVVQPNPVNQQSNIDTARLNQPNQRDTNPDRGSTRGFKRRFT